MKKPAYKRIVLKLSGEVLRGSKQETIDIEFTRSIIRQIRDVLRLGTSVCIVVGGGNILRGSQAAGGGLDRVSADYIGMLGTAINGLAIRGIASLENVEVRLVSALPLGSVAETYSRQRTLEHLDKGRVVVFVGGTGNPFYTTDTAAALRAAEVGADVILKATKVDGVYTGDPVVDSSARRFEKLTFKEALSMELGFMDRAALCLCDEMNIRVVVFNVYEKDSIKRVVLGEKVGTIVEGVSND